jgi:NTP pyrophosphatase (non-canonical NTP hydrolase)
MGTTQNMTDLQKLAAVLQQFADDRDWNQFHTPKNLSMALAAEAGELLEEFQWLTDKESCALTPDQRTRVSDEMADVFNYLVRLSSKLDIDLFEAAYNKIEKNARKYPVDKAKGNARKYTEFAGEQGATAV